MYENVYISRYIYIYTQARYLCMYVSIYLSIHVSMFLCLYEPIHVPICIYVQICPERRPRTTPLGGTPQCSHSPGLRVKQSSAQIFINFESPHSKYVSSYAHWILRRGPVQVSTSFGSVRGPRLVALRLSGRGSCGMLAVAGPSERP